MSKKKKKKKPETVRAKQNDRSMNMIVEMWDFHGLDLKMTQCHSIVCKAPGVFTGG